MNTAFPDLELQLMQEYQHTQEREEERLAMRERRCQTGVSVMLTKNQQMMEEMLMPRVDFFSSASSEASSCLLLYQPRPSTS